MAARSVVVGDGREVATGTSLGAAKTSSTPSALTGGGTRAATIGVAGRFEDGEPATGLGATTSSRRTSVAGTVDALIASEGMGGFGTTGFSGRTTCCVDASPSTGAGAAS